MSIYNALNIPSQSNGLVVGTGTGFAASTLGGANGMDVAFATGAITLSNLRDCSRYVVSTVAGETGYTSIQAAINQAESDGASEANPATVFIWEGNYTENLSLSPWVDLVSFSKNTKITGSVTFTSGNVARLINLNFTVAESFGSEILTISNSVLYLYNTEFNAEDSTSPGLSLTSGSYLYLYNQSAITSQYVAGPAYIFSSSFLICNSSSFSSLSSQEISATASSFLFNKSSMNGSLNLLNSTVEVAACSIYSENEIFNVSLNSSVFLKNTTISCFATSNNFIDGAGTLAFSGIEFDALSTAKTIAPTINQVGQYNILSVLGNTGGAVPVTTQEGQLTLVGSGGITVTGSPSTNTLTISASGSGSISWQTISASQALSVNNGYFCISPGGAIALSLPTTSAVGDTIIVTLDGATSYTITQGANQQIRFGSQETTLGASGSLTTTSQGCTLSLVCSVANLRWNAISSEGTFTIV